MAILGWFHTTALEILSGTVYLSIGPSVDRKKFTISELGHYRVPIINYMYTVQTWNKNHSDRPRPLPTRRRHMSLFSWRSESPSSSKEVRMDINFNPRPPTYPAYPQAPEMTF